ncbi:MAG: PGF-pre-PGF domain-containing protein [Candidatus Aenigmarchaeota archaeon]|nr:PGF-pre-PGF domain-containing protein [Candidatus Aenigmarchaeota archaeon]
MKNKTILVIAIVLASLLVVPVFAACTGVCSTSTQYSCSKSATTLTKGTSATLTATITNMQSNAVTSLSATLQGSWFTASSSSTTIASIQASGGTGTADFSITPTATGGQDVCVSLGSTCTADCGTITVSSAAELSVTSITAPSSVSTSSAFTVSATIANGGTETAGSTTGVTATLTSSQCTVSSETKTIGTIAGSGTSSVSWSVTAPSSAATCTFSLSATGTPGGTATGTKSVTISSTATTTTASGGGTGGGGGGGGSVNDTTNKTISRAVVINETKVTAEKNKNIITIPSISKNTVALVNIPDAAADVTKVAFAVNNNVTNVSMTITKLDKTPVAPVLSGKVFSYIQIDKNVADSDISSATIEFQIEKTWLNANKIDKGTVTLNRLSGSAWTRLITKQTGETATHAVYQAESPGLSIFAITGSELPTTTTAPISLPQVVKDYGIWIAIFVIVAAVLGYLYYHGHRHVRKAAKFAYDFRKK